MNTSNTNFDYSNLTDEQLKSIALLQYHSETFFVLDDKVFMGEKESLMTEYENNEEYKESSFYDYCVAEAIEVEEYDENDWNLDYICLTDSEADEKAAEYIKDTLWAFNAEFLASETGLDAEIFTAIQENGKCEDNNDMLYNLINKTGSIDSFIESAISADGRGHFMSSYDGNENEEAVNGVTYYIYRIN